ncbi:hypothetical protein TNCV_1800621 [Trichonephila clavipes]|nr:hypothetical protein TNCV_1800621 [Trichonephila clavipes]
MSTADSHHQVTEVYGTEAMSDCKVRKWVRKFKDGRTNVHDKERSVWSSVITRADLSRCAARSPPVGGQNKGRLQAVYGSVNRRYEFDVTTSLLRISENKTYNKSNKYAEF